MFTAGMISTVFYLSFNYVISQHTMDVEKLLNWCIDSENHKTEPGPEGTLYQQCIPWKDKSCCTSETTESIQDPHSLSGFNYHHCSDVQSLSDECLKHFIQDHCFYECSPNLGPWIVKQHNNWRKERFYKVPLCASDCEVWFNACQYDYTCTDNWSKNFDWVSKDCDGIKCKRNICPQGAKCQTFLNIFRTAENFCQQIYDDAWEYTQDDDYCMRMWFNGSLGNPNDQVAQVKARQLTQISKASGSNGNLLIFIVVLALCAAL